MSTSTNYPLFEGFQHITLNSAPDLSQEAHTAQMMCYDLITESRRLWRDLQDEEDQAIADRDLARANRLVCLQQRAWARYGRRYQAVYGKGW